MRMPPSATGIVGREEELARLHGWLEKTLQGERQVVFVTGEPGIGKTTLVDAFVAGLAGNPHLLISREQCIEYYGVGEPYQPVLEAFGRLGRESEDERLVALLGRCAPTWLAQMPMLVGAADFEA